MNQEYRVIVRSPFDNKKIVQNGLIVYALKERTWLVVPDRNSNDFNLLIRGEYRLSQLPYIYKNLSKQERERLTELLHHPPADFVKYCTTNFTNIDTTHAYNQMAQARSYLLKFSDPVDRDSWQHLPCYMTNQNNIKDHILHETGVNLPPALYISNGYILSNIISSNGYNYETKYWLYVIEEQLNQGVWVDDLKLEDSALAIDILQLVEELHTMIALSEKSLRDNLTEHSFDLGGVNDAGACFL